MEAKKEKKEKKPKKHRHRDHDVQLELIEEPAVDGAKDRAAGDSADAAPAKPAAAPVVQLPVEPVVAKPPKEKARSASSRRSLGVRRVVTLVPQIENNSRTVR